MREKNFPVLFGTACWGKISCTVHDCWGKISCTVQDCWGKISCTVLDCWGKNFLHCPWQPWTHPVLFRIALNPSCAVQDSVQSMLWSRTELIQSCGSQDSAPSILWPGQCSVNLLLSSQDNAQSLLLSRTALNLVVPRTTLSQSCGPQDSAQSTCGTGQRSVYIRAVQDIAEAIQTAGIRSLCELAFAPTNIFAPGPLSSPNYSSQQPRNQKLLSNLPFLVFSKNLIFFQLIAIFSLFVFRFSLMIPNPSIFLSCTLVIIVCLQRESTKINIMCSPLPPYLRRLVCPV